MGDGWSPVLFSSARSTGDAENDKWGTPRSVFNPLHAEFGFGIDVAAARDSALCPVWLGPEQEDPSLRDALSVDWALVGGGKPAWSNPPYSGAGSWVELAGWHAAHRDLLTVLLIFARTDTRWWWRGVLGRDPVTGARLQGTACASEIRWTPGRIAYVDPATGQPRRHPRTGQIQRAPAPAVLLVYRPGDVVDREWPDNAAAVLES